MTTTATARKLVKAYQYHDVQGQLIYERLRFEPKGFSQRRPNPDFNADMPEDKANNPRWIWDLKGVKMLLYGLPLLKAEREKNPERAVLFVEGEGVVEECRKDGLLATTSGPALQWHEIDDKCKEVLKGANVVILPDNDPYDAKMGFSPGMKHAEEVAADLKRFCKTVKIVTLPNLPPKGDYKDWKNSEGIKDLEPAQRRQIIADLVKAAPLFQNGTPPKEPPGPRKAVPTPVKCNQVPASILLMADVLDELKKQGAKVTTPMDALVRMQTHMALAMTNAQAGKDCGFDLLRIAGIIALSLEQLPEFKQLLVIPSAD